MVSLTSKCCDLRREQSNKLCNKMCALNLFFESGISQYKEPCLSLEKVIFLTLRTWLFAVFRVAQCIGPVHALEYPPVAKLQA